MSQQKLSKLKHTEKKSWWRSTEQNTQELWGNTRQPKICVSGIPEGKKSTRQRIFKEIMADKPYTVNDKFQHRSKKLGKKTKQENNMPLPPPPKISPYLAYLNI